MPNMTERQHVEAIQEAFCEPETTVIEGGRLPEEYWGCPLCIVTLMVAHAEGRIDHERAYRALERSGLVEPWPENEGMVRATEKGREFIEMILATPLPVNRWIDPRTLEDTRR